jgi:hypothetical protein
MKALNRGLIVVIGAVAALAGSVKAQPDQGNLRISQEAR